MPRRDPNPTNLEGWAGPIRFCIGMASIGASICAGLGAYGCWFSRDVARAVGGGEKAQGLGLALPYPIAITLLTILCLLSAFVAIYAFFFPTQSSTET